MFSLSHHAHIVVQVLRKPEEKDYGRQKTRFWGIYGQLALFRKQEKMCLFSEGKDQNRNWGFFCTVYKEIKLPWFHNVLLCEDDRN